jgi:glycosyltransferase involved in cell wall biosynthesis
MNKVLKKINIRHPYLFYVGNAHPHKNMEGLIKAFLILRKKYQHLQLVLAGKSDFFWEGLKKEYKQKDIIYTGFVNDEELVSLYKNAQAFVSPSFSEGFGIPTLEAFATSCPVVLSNKTALPEIGGDAALYFEPYDIEDMVEKTSLVLNNKKLRRELIEELELNEVDLEFFKKYTNLNPTTGIEVERSVYLAKMPDLRNLVFHEGKAEVRRFENSFDVKVLDKPRTLVRGHFEHKKFVHNDKFLCRNFSSGRSFLHPNLKNVDNHILDGTQEHCSW